MEHKNTTTHELPVYFWVLRSVSTAEVNTSMLSTLTSAHTYFNHCHLPTLCKEDNYFWGDNHRRAISKV